MDYTFTECWTILLDVVDLLYNMLIELMELGYIFVLSFLSGAKSA